MRFRPDYSETIETIPPGTYSAKIVGYKESVSKHKGTPLIAWDLEVTDDDDFDGAPFTHFTVLNGPGAGILLQFLRAANESYSSGEFQPEDFLGRRVTASLVESRMPDGRLGRYPRVVDVRRHLAPEGSGDSEV